MTISDEIRSLASQGLAVADIARRLGIRYQHAYGVLNKLPNATRARKTEAVDAIAEKPDLPVDYLLLRGFEHAGRWVLSDSETLVLERPLPKQVGVYAFAKGSIVQYVGVATMGLAKRIYFYGRPGITQRTSLRINSLLRAELAASQGIDIYVAMPPDLEWNGLPVHGAAGLELGLIKKFSLPWNMRSAGTDTMAS